MLLLHPPAKARKKYASSKQRTSKGRYREEVPEEVLHRYVCRRAVGWVLLLLLAAPRRGRVVTRLAHPLLLDVPRKDREHRFFKDDGDVDTAVFRAPPGVVEIERLTKNDRKAKLKPSSTSYPVLVM